MMILIVALCLAAGPGFYVRCFDFGLGDEDDGKTIRFGDKDQFITRTNDVIGAGSFGMVFHAIDTINGREVAAKVESMSEGTPLLPSESEAYAKIGEQNGIPKTYYNGTAKYGMVRSYVLVMQLLGKSLLQLQNENGGQFSPKTVYMIGIQTMNRIESIHRKRYVHRDIKPGNMAIGKSGTLIYIFDFGLAEIFKDDKRRHIPEGIEEAYGSGTPRYMSAYAHSHNTQSRRDDLESIGFMLMSFLKGNLPWDRVSFTKPAKLNPMAQMKVNLDLDSFCNGYKQMLKYFEHLRSDKMEFHTKPDYNYLRELFRSALKDMNETEDLIFDWTSNL